MRTLPAIIVGTAVFAAGLFTGWLVFDSDTSQPSKTRAERCLELGGVFDVELRGCYEERLDPLRTDPVPPERIPLRPEDEDVAGGF